ncbi:MAG: hypothetical protein V4671_22190, partial [Armatimonadota bacterium]
MPTTQTNSRYTLCALRDRALFGLLIAPLLFSPWAAQAQSKPPVRQAMQASSSATLRKSFRFDFGPSKAVAPGYVKVAPGIAYTDEQGFGFEEGAAAVTGIDRGGSDPLRDDFCTSDRPFLFSVRLPEGNYRVTL